MPVLSLSRGCSVNAHGTSTGVGDLSELRAAKSIFGDAPKNTWVGAPRLPWPSPFLGAAGAIEAIITAAHIVDQICPPTINLINPEEEVGDFNLVPNVAQKHDIEYALSNNFGFMWCLTAYSLPHYKVKF